MGGHPATSGREQPRLRLLQSWRLDVASSELCLPERPQRLVALLALRGRLKRSLAAGTLWPTTSHDRALGSLRVALWQVAHAAPGVVDTTRDAVELGEHVAVDVHELRAWAAGVHTRRVPQPARAAAASTAPSLAAPPVPALVLDGGDLLPGWYDDWVLVERERLHHLRLRALEAACDQLLAEGRHAEALATALSAVRAEPLRESSHRAVLRVHLARDDHAAALSHYRGFCALLAAELGVAPSPSVQALVCGPVNGAATLSTTRSAR